MLISTLQQVGLNEKQSKIYLACLELGESSVKEIAQKSGIKRTTIYDFIDEMVNAGFLKQTVQGKKKKFIASDPEELKILLKKREALLSQIMPQLNSISKMTKARPKIWFYHGVSGLKKVYADTLNYPGEILAIGGEDIVNEVSLDWILAYIKKRVKKKIFVRGIVARTDLLEKEIIAENKRQLRTTKIINPEKFPFPIEINIYGKKRVFFVSPNEQTAVIIEGTEIFRAMKSFFELVWEGLPENFMD